MEFGISTPTQTNTKKKSLNPLVLEGWTVFSTLLLTCIPHEMSNCPQIEDTWRHDKDPKGGNLQNPGSKSQKLSCKILRKFY